MKKYISYLLTLALLVPAFVSCTEQLEDLRTKNQKTHTVYFSTTDRATKTGLKIEDNLVKPDWRKTQPENVHFFEIDANKDAAYGVADPTEGVGIQLSQDERTAHFKAVFMEGMVIHIDPDTGEEDNSKGAKSSSRVSPFTFAAVVAQKEADAYTFVIPSEQHPEAETLKDPNAEFLVGYSRKSYADQYDFESDVVDLYFDRVAALGRLAITGFVGTGEKVKSVTITATGGMTGKATYPGDFTLGDKNKVNFTKVDEPLVLDYGKNGVDAPASGAFYAYFVAVPGETSITSIEVLTDQYKYTKTNEEGAEFTFSDSQLLNINFDLSDVTAEPVSSGKVYRKVTAETDLEVGAQYLLVYENASGSKVFKPIYTTYTSGSSVRSIFLVGEENALDVSITDATIISSDFEECEMTLVEGCYFYVASAEYYLYPTNSSYYPGCIAAEDESTTDHKFAISISNGIATISRTSNNSVYNFCYSDSDSDPKALCFRGSSSVSANVVLYKYDDSRTPQTLSFSEPGPFDYDLDEGGDFEEPTLTSASGTIYGEVTFKSSDESIATVASDGEVTFQNTTGPVVITATAAGDDANKPASASYTITVISNKVPTWYKVDEVENGGTYMIVSNGSALKNNSGSIAAVTESDLFTGDTFQYENDENLIWEATVTNSSFTLKNDGKYLRRSSGLQISTSSSSLTYDGSYLKIAGSSSSYVLYCNNGTWTTGNSTSSSRVVALYTTNPPLLPRNLAFSSTSVSHDVTGGTEFNEPTLTGASSEALAGVTYAVTSDSKGVVASIDATTGAITLASGKTGTAVITASAAADEIYKAESVSYSLIVKEGSAPLKYVKVTSTSDLETGATYLLVYEGGKSGDNADPKVFRPTLATNGNTFNKIKDDALAVEITNSTITSDNYVSGHLTLETGYYLKVDAADRYLYSGLGSDDRGALFAETSKSNALSITFTSEGIAQIKPQSGTYYLVWSTSSNYFSASEDVEGSYSTGICLYKLDDGASPSTPEEQDQSLSFPEASYTAQVGTAFTAPSVSGAQTTVTYTSSKETVATVNANTGAVTLVGPGETIITASAAAEIVDGISYKAASAQYTLTVNAAPGTEKYYVLVTSEPASWNGKYLIVNTAADGTGTAMNGTGTANVTISGGKIQSTSTIDGYALTVTSAGEVHPNQTDSSQGLIAYDITFSDGDWLYWYSRGYKQTTENQSTRHNKCTLFYDNGVRLMSAGYNVNLNGQSISDPSKNYLYYQTSGSYTMSSSHSSDRVQLYKLDDGGTTPGGGDDPQPPTPSTTTYSRVSFATGISTGKYLIVNPADAQVFTTVTSYPNSASVTPSNGVISGDYASYEVTITKSGDNYTIQNASGQYLYYVYTSGDTETRVAYKSDTENWAASSVSSDANGFDLNCAGGSGRQHIYWNNSSAGTFFKLGSQSTGVHLYKKAENP